MDLPVIVLGGGGHAKVVIDVLHVQGRQVLGYCDLNQNGLPILGVPRLGSEEAIFQLANEKVRLINGIGSIKPGSLRSDVYARFASKGYLFDQLIHPSAVVTADVVLDTGVQIMARVVLQPGSRIGMNTIINTGVSVDHNCVVGSHVHIAPGVVLCGDVQVGDGAHIGAGATVIQGISIGAKSMVGAGAVVVDDVPAEATVVGIPAKIVTK